jgi:hypothetical protein
MPCGYSFSCSCASITCAQVSPKTASRRRPGTYEYYPLRFWNRYSLKDVSLLRKTSELEPDKPDTYHGFISHQEFTGKYWGDETVLPKAI